MINLITPVLNTEIIVGETRILGHSFNYSMVEDLLYPFKKLNILRFLCIKALIIIIYKNNAGLFSLHDQAIKKDARTIHLLFESPYVATNYPIIFFNVTNYCVTSGIIWCLRCKRILKWYKARRETNDTVIKFHTHLSSFPSILQLKNPSSL